MEKLERILREHARRYPKMQPTDAVKLIYQNEFGGGHLIREEQVCMNYLRSEYASVEKDASIPLYEDIGNGIVRVNLAAVKEEHCQNLYSGIYGYHGGLCHLIASHICHSLCGWYNRTPFIPFSVLCHPLSSVAT